MRGSYGPKPYFSIAQIGLQDSFAKQKMSRYFPNIVEFEDISTDSKVADLPKPIASIVANLPKQRECVKPYVTSVSSEKYFATVGKAPRNHFRLSKTRIHERSYVPKSPMPRIVPTEEGIFRALPDPERKRKDLVSNGTSDEDGAEDYDLVDAETEETLNMGVSDSKDEFEVVDKVGQSEHNGTMRKWYKGYCR
jgi:hypothetical protein